jgi:hypothetical protein
MCERKGEDSVFAFPHPPSCIISCPMTNTREFLLIGGMSELFVIKEENGRVVLLNIEILYENERG